MNKYESIIIFKEALKDEDVTTALNRFKDEVKKLDGNVLGVTKLGRRPFARKMNKQTAGHYVMMSFDMDGAKVAALEARAKFFEEIFRLQVVRAPARIEVVEALVSEGSTDGES